jgi:hypothetical protein
MTDASTWHSGDTPAVWLYDNADEPFTAFLDEVCAPFSMRWDDDIAQSGLVLNIAEHYGPLDHLIYDLDYEGEVDEVVTITFNRRTSEWAIVGTAPEPSISGAEVSRA